MLLKLISLSIVFCMSVSCQKKEPKIEEKKNGSKGEQGETDSGGYPGGGYPGGGSYDSREVEILYSLEIENLLGKNCDNLNLSGQAKNEAGSKSGCDAAKVFMTHYLIETEALNCDEIQDAVDPVSGQVNGGNPLLTTLNLNEGCDYKIQVKLGSPNQLYPFSNKLEIIPNLQGLDIIDGARFTADLILREDVKSAGFDLKSRPLPPKKKKPDQKDPSPPQQPDDKKPEDKKPEEKKPEDKKPDDKNPDPKKKEKEKNPPQTPKPDPTPDPHEKSKGSESWYKCDAMFVYLAQKTLSGQDIFTSVVIHFGLREEKKMMRLSYEQPNIVSFPRSFVFRNYVSKYGFENQNFETIYSDNFLKFHLVKNVDKNTFHVVWKKKSYKCESSSKPEFF